MAFRNGFPKGSFTAIPNKLIKDRNISDTTFRLISWIASHEEDYDITFSTIEWQLGYKREKIRNAIKNAEDNGYLIRIRERIESTGQFDWQYYVFTSQQDAIAFKSSRGINDDSIGDKPTGGLTTPGSPTGGLSTGGETTHVYIEEKELKNQSYNTSATTATNKDATLDDAAAAARANKRSEFDETKNNEDLVNVNPPHIVNSQESVTTEKDNQVDQSSAARAREQLSLSRKQEYLKLAGIRNNATLNKAMSTKSIDEVVMALGFLFEKEDETKRNGKEPIHNRAAYFKRALEDGSALDWCQMMEYTKLGVELWKWATEARLRGIFARFDVGSNNAWIKDGFCTYKIDATKELCEQWGWDVFCVEIAKYDRKRRKESQQQTA